jgi:hypothetical protein
VRPPNVSHAGIVDAGREFVLGRTAIIDRRDDASSTGAHISAHPVMGVQAAQDETAAVKEHEQREGCRAVRRVDANAQRPARPVDGLLADAGNVGRGCHQSDARFILGARRIDRHGVRGGHAGALLEQRPDLRIDRHYLARRR